MFWYLCLKQNWVTMSKIQITNFSDVYLSFRGPFLFGYLCVLNKFRGRAHALKMIKLVVGSEGGSEKSCGLRIEIALHVIGSVLMCFEVT